MYGSAIFFALLAAILCYSGFLEEVDQMVSDSLYQAINKHQSNLSIKIIAIDEKTEEEYGPYQNWQRSQMADLISVLNRNPVCAPDVIGFDLDVSGEKDSEGDNALTAVCSNYTNICMGALATFKKLGVGAETQTGQEGSKKPDIPVAALCNDNRDMRQPGGVSWSKDWLDDDEAFQVEVRMPYEGLLEHIKTGIINSVRNSEDGFARNSIASLTIGNETIDSFAVAVYKLYCDSRGMEYSLPKLDDEYSFGFTYTKQSQEYTVYSYTDVVNQNVSPLAFRKSIVLVGDYTDKDAVYKVPNQRETQMQGTEVQANILEAILGEKTGQPVSKGFRAVFYAIFIGLFYIATSYSSGKSTVIIALLLNGIQIAGCVLLNHWGYYINILVPAILVVIVALYNLFLHYAVVLQNKMAVERVFTQYVDKRIVDELGKDGKIEARIGVERRDIAVMFVDIRGFTSLSENLDPEQVVGILNDYLALVSYAVSKYNGTLDKFIGDAAMAVFNSPFDLDDYEYRAVCSAWELLSNAAALSQKCMDIYGKQVGFGIGIQCGEAVVGNIGCESRMDFTAIGDTVNTASRLEGAALPGQILISQEMADRLGERIQISFAGEMVLKGKEKKVPAYSVEGM